MRTLDYRRRFTARSTDTLRVLQELEALRYGYALGGEFRVRRAATRR